MLLVLVAVVIVFGTLGIIQARARTADRRDLLTPCVGLLASPKLSIAPDGFPRLSGRLDGHHVRLAVIPDTLALRRLPQLWFSIEMVPASRLPHLVVTARPRGDDYVSEAFDAAHQVDVPDWLPRDTMVRLDDGGPDGDDLLNRLRQPLAALFENPLVKELSLRPRGMRLVYRLAEGERAYHLLLRQSHFTACVEPDLFVGLAKHLEAFDLPAAVTLADAA